MAKALGLISGGLDSAIAVRLMLDQGIEVTALHFNTWFSDAKIAHETLGMVPPTVALCHELNVPLICAPQQNDYLEMIKRPPHSYGQNLNPCLDCHNYFLIKARELMLEQGFDFVFTGEVLGQRPMSQTSHHLKFLQTHSGLNDRLLRPLSARLMEETYPEKSGMLDRNKLLAIHGRSRTQQIAFVKERGLRYFSAPGGGCDLTDRNFSVRFVDLLDAAHPALPTYEQTRLLKFGRHFRMADGAKYVVTRSEAENESVFCLAKAAGNIIVKPDGFPGPSVVVDSTGADGFRFGADAVQIAASLMMIYGKPNKPLIAAPQVKAEEPDGTVRGYPLPAQPLFTIESAAAYRIDRENVKVRKTGWQNF